MIHEKTMRAVVDRLITATNAFDIDAALPLFSFDTMIDDPSTGSRYEGHAGIRDYIERYFVGYNTVTRFLATEYLTDIRARVRVDFTGDFGHEIGILDISLGNDGLIRRIDADLE